MEEKREISTIAISVDEYFDLRKKAEMNAFLMERMGRFQAQFTDIDRRLRDLELLNKRN